MMIIKIQSQSLHKKWMGQEIVDPNNQVNPADTAPQLAAPADG